MAKVTSTRLISTEEYIARFVEGGEKPMCEYIDGALRTKPIPTRKHSQVQANVIPHIGRNNEEQSEALPELTTQLRKAKFYVPDISAEDLAHPIQGRYPGSGDPVFLCVEIKSPDDRIGKLFSKSEDYHTWGVPHCWIIDPERKVAREYTPNDPEPRKSDLALNAGPIQIALTGVFRRG
jgi:Uma2 family endonuclease